jgi:hypothetical protein
MRRNGRLTISSMYHTHAKAVAQRQGRAPANSRISMFTDLNPPEGGSTTSSDPYNNTSSETHAERKITAVVDVPQSKYSYNAVEPPIIETPQLRDMGEATPPMEWIGLHRERLPHLTHQVCFPVEREGDAIERGMRRMWIG